MEMKLTRYEVAKTGVATIRFSGPGRGNSWAANVAKRPAAFPGLGAAGR